ncbi:hypothetical protein CI610_02348 [invertebrate metagenome]|uniref:NAD/FAD-utilizing enzyme apparently involved in cell division n=1 Tax=invertebrate metagenome TaxID=1711999 RepID=A0A2H9T669_9ZZZZ
MRQHHYLLPDLEAAERLSLAIESSGVDHQHIHVIHRDRTSLEQRHLNGLSVIEESDVLHCGERGLLVGVLLAIAVGFSLYEWLEGHPVVAVVVFFAVVVIVGFATWVGGMIGASSDNYRLAPYHDDILQGKAVVMVDLLPEEASSVIEMVAQDFNEAKYCGMSDSVDNPFQGGWALRKHERL